MELDLPEIINLGDRVIDFPGLPSQRCGTVVDFMPIWNTEGCWPVVHWDAGYRSVSSYEWGLRKLAPVEQLSLFTEV